MGNYKAVALTEPIITGSSAIRELYSGGSCNVW